MTDTPRVRITFLLDSDHKCSPDVGCVEADEVREVFRISSDDISAR